MVKVHEEEVEPSLKNVNDIIKCFAEFNFASTFCIKT